MKIRWLPPIAVIIIGSFYPLGNVAGCDLSDKEAIRLAINFNEKMNIIYSQKPWVLRIDNDYQVNDMRFKKVVFGIRGDYIISLHASCNNKEIDFYYNSELNRKIRNKYNIPSVSWEPHNWPPFLSESEAREKIFAIANKIELPKDAEFYSLGIDKENGYWGGTWIRKLGGFRYENDRIDIDIMAVDGEFVRYGKRYVGKPCPTEVTVTKEEAMEEGWEQIIRLFSKVDWDKQKTNYKIKSADLRIVQPNVLAGKIVSRWSTESRLAWVLVYELKRKPDLRKLKEIDYFQRITIKIDADTKKLLGGDFTQ